MPIVRCLLIAVVALCALVAVPVRADWSGGNQPVRFLVFGDSLAQGYAYGVRQAVQHRNDRFAGARVSDQVRIGIGLIPRRGLDPVAAIGQALATAHPPIDAVIVSLGVNDVGMPLGAVPFYGDQWQQAYRDRLTAFLTAATAGDTQVVWIQVPAVRPTAFAGPLDATIRGLQDTVVDGYADVVLAETVSLTQSGGEFQTHMITASGASQRLRAGDGIHFTGLGYVAVADRALDALATLPVPAGREWQPPQAPVPPPLPIARRTAPSN